MKKKVDRKLLRKQAKKEFKEFTKSPANRLASFPAFFKAVRKMKSNLVLDPKNMETSAAELSAEDLAAFNGMMAELVAEGQADEVIIPDLVEDAI